MFVSLDGLTIHYRLDGPPGSAPLALVNSLGSDLRIWDEVVASFAQRLRVLRYDLRGHGLSDAPPGPYSVVALGEDLRRLLDAVGFGRVVVMGISVGGMIALELGLRHPDRVRALILCDTGARIGSTESWDSRIDQVRERGLGDIAETIVDRWFGPGFAARDPAAFRGYCNMLARTSVEGYVAICAALRDADYRDSAGAVESPALVVTGSDDVSTPPQVGRELSEALPRAGFEVVEDAGHLVCVERPDDLVRSVQRFLKEASLV